MKIISEVYSILLKLTSLYMSLYFSLIIRFVEDQELSAISNFIGEKTAIH